MSQTLVSSLQGGIPPKREITTKPRLSDRIFRGIVTSGALSSLLILGLIFFFLAFQGFSVLRSQGIHFITSSTWQVVQDNAGNIDPKATKFGIAAMLIGTLLCALIAIIVAVPISVLSALFLNFYAPPFLKKILVAVVDLMAAGLVLFLLTLIVNLGADLVVRRSGGKGR